MILDASKPSLDLYRQVRAGAIAMGLSFTALAQQLGYGYNPAKMALTGTWNGVKGQECRKRLVAAVTTSVNEMRGAS